MKLKEIHENGSAYLVAHKKMSYDTFRTFFPVDEEYVEFPLNDHAMEDRGTRLPYYPKINLLIQEAIDMGAELLWIHQGKKK